MIPRTPDSTQEALRLAEHLTAAMTTAGALNVRRSFNHEPSWWLRCRLSDIDRAAINGRLETCRHTRGTGVAVVALWAPSSVWCLRCAPAALVLEGEDDRRCDRCGVVVDDLITVMTACAGQVLVVFGLCRPCRDREEARR